MGNPFYEESTKRTLSVLCKNKFIVRNWLYNSLSLRIQKLFNFRWSHLVTINSVNKAGLSHNNQFIESIN